MVAWGVRLGRVDWSGEKELPPLGYMQSPRPIHIELLQEGIPWEWPQDAGKRFRT